MTEVLKPMRSCVLMSVIEDGRRDDLTDGLPWTVLDGLAELVRCDCASAQGSTWRRAMCSLNGCGTPGYGGSTIGDGDRPAPPEYWKCVREFLPFSYAQRTGGAAPGGSLVGHLHSQPQLRNTPLCAEYHGSEATKHGLHESFVPGFSWSLPQAVVLARVANCSGYKIYLNSQRRRKQRPST